MSLAILFLPAFSDSSTRIPINREILGISLGMEESSFVRGHDVRLVDAAPEAGYRLYEVAASHDADVRSVSVAVFDGRVLKVDVEFSRWFVDSVGWFDLVKRYNRRYGFSPITQTETPSRITDLVDWNDGLTHLALRHIWQPNEDGTLDSVYRASYLDADYLVKSMRLQAVMAQLPAAVER